MDKENCLKLKKILDNCSKFYANQTYNNNFNPCNSIVKIIKDQKCNN